MKRRTWAAWLVLALLALSALLAACAPAPAAGPSPTAATLPPVALASPAALTATLPVDAADLHPAEGAGRWYPADPETLRAAVAAYVDQAVVEPVPGRLLAVIVPHAGYLYSGAVAGHAYRALQQAGCAGHTLAVIGDTHTGHGSADIAVWAAGAFETPLGTLPVDAEVAQALLAADRRIAFDRDAFAQEHPVENQLPFLQAVCPGARIVPLVIREPSLENAQLLAEALVEALGDRPAVIVASTDLSHYHPYDEARQMDAVALEAIASLDPQAVADSPRRCAELGLGGGDPLTMCSQGAVMTALIAARQMGADQATVLHYANSGDVPVGSRDQVVGYGAVALWQSRTPQVAPQGSAPDLQPPPSTLQSPSSTLHSPTSTLQLPTPISPVGQQALLTLARRTAEQFLTTETVPPFHSDDPALLQPLGAYVTYRKEGELRGCLGRLEGDRPAYLNVQYAALAAALGDQRFPPVTAEELDQLALEITLLYPMRPVDSPDQIDIGRDGVLMRVGQEAGALFLPQVPPEQGWDLDETLVQLCRKAGLPDDAWQQPDARFYAFAGQWFGEGE